VPSFTIGLDRAGPDERTQAAEAARVLGSKLTMVTMDRSKIGDAFPELIMAAEGPVLDTSCAALLKLAAAVHDQGFKVALTGEGADEALAGYIWYKTQKVREAITRVIGERVPRMIRRLAMASIGGGSAHRSPERAIGGVRTAQQDMYEMIGQARVPLYSREMWDRIGDHDPFSDLDVDRERIGRWDPLNQSLYVGYKVMLAGLLMISKGDRIAMHSSVETRYPFLDDDVIKFCSEIAPEYKLRGLTEKWLLRRVAAKTLPPLIANRPKTMFRASLSRTFLDEHRPPWVDELLSPESLRRTGYFDPDVVSHERRAQMMLPRITPRRFVFDVALTCVVSTQLWHHTFCGGGLCDLPEWSPPVREDERVPEVAVGAP
jgi:asparagine synthase (glutamine-hydrolysing)